MKEFKVISGDDVMVQKLLNQWKHEFNIKIISMSTCSHTAGILGIPGLIITTILLVREKDNCGCTTWTTTKGAEHRVNDICLKENE